MWPLNVLLRRRWAPALCVAIAVIFSFSVMWRLQSHVPLPVKSRPFAGTAAASGPGVLWPYSVPVSVDNPSPTAQGMDAALCQALGQNLTDGSFPMRSDKDWPLRQLQLLQSCPWAHNASVLDRYREKLGRCCNASTSLVLTCANTPLGSHIIYDGQRTKKLLVQEELLEILPQESPFRNVPYERCAIVGSGGILRNSKCGSEIDRAQFIIRFNIPPLGFDEDVGNKSSAVTMNPSILHVRFRSLNRLRRPFTEAVGAYGAALLLIPAFSFTGHVEVSLQAFYALQDFHSPARAIFMNPKYLLRLHRHWWYRGLRTARLSSGFILVSSALELCQHLTLYGFWPFDKDPEGRPLFHHYYDNQPPMQRVHNMPAEFIRYLGLHLQGALRLHVGRCR